MKFQIPTMHHSKVNRRTHAHTDRQAESIKTYFIKTIEDIINITIMLLDIHTF